jgi:hypothetical protein
VVVLGVRFTTAFALSVLFSLRSETGRPKRERGSKPLSFYMSTKKHSHRKKTTPYSTHHQWDIAYRDLLAKHNVKSSCGANSISVDRKVREVGLGTWQVSGGECVHKVTLASVNGPLICLDHSPPHPPTKPGYGCCHVLAVYKRLAWNHVPSLFTPDGFRQKESPR